MLSLNRNSTWTVIKRTCPNSFISQVSSIIYLFVCCRCCSCSDCRMLGTARISPAHTCNPRSSQISPRHRFFKAIQYFLPLFPFFSDDVVPVTKALLTVSGPPFFPGSQEITSTRLGGEEYILSNGQQMEGWWRWRWVVRKKWLPEMTWRGVLGNFHSHVSELTHLPLEVQSSISGNPKIITTYCINIDGIMVKVG